MNLLSPWYGNEPSRKANRAALTRPNLPFTVKARCWPVAHKISFSFNTTCLSWPCYGKGMALPIYQPGSFTSCDFPGIAVCNAAGAGGTEPPESCVTSSCSVSCWAGYLMTAFRVPAGLGMSVLCNAIRWNSAHQELSMALGKPCHRSPASKLGPKGQTDALTRCLSDF